MARVGGDEFTVILPDIARPEDAEIVARKIVAALSAPIRLERQGRSVEIGCSIGVALYPSDAADADALVSAADARCTRPSRPAKVIASAPGASRATPRAD